MKPEYKVIQAKSIEQVHQKYVMISILAPGLAEKCLPGMFFELKAEVPSQVNRLFKPVSIYQVNEGEITFLIKIVGEGTAALAAMKAGDPLKLIGPLGNSFPIVEGRNILLVSGGVGYPPLSYLQNKLKDTNQITFLHGGACAEDIFPCDRIYTLDGSTGEKGLVTQDIKDLISKEKIDLVYSCGPIPMLKALAEIVSPTEHYVSLEAYMACGLGVCHGCVVPVGKDYLRVCKEGPVFNAADIRWEEL